MKKKIRQLSYKLQQKMIGRYGPDKLWLILFISYFVVMTIANIVYRYSKISYWALFVLSQALIIFAIYRFFSKNLEARRSELASWMKIENGIKGFFKLNKDKFKQRKTHKFVKCKRCKRTLRLPRHKGKLNVTCPHCQNQFTVNTGKKIDK